MDLKSVFSEVNGKNLQSLPPNFEIGYNNFTGRRRRRTTTTTTTTKKTKQKQTKQRTNSSGKTSTMFLRLHNKNSNR